jgi:predicted nuclease of predicted toxin-antitoxin system
MKLLIDAQLPRRLALFLQSKGHNAIHTLDLANGNQTTDQEINLLSIREERIVITKDADFVNSFTLHQQPYKLLLLSIGNINNHQLLALLETHISTVEQAFEEHHYVELEREHLIVHV